MRFGVTVAEPRGVRRGWTSRSVPVTRRLLADSETAVGIYRKLAGNRPGTVLLESAEQGKRWSRYSFVGVRSAGVLTERDGVTQWLGDAVPGPHRRPARATRWPPSGRWPAGSGRPGCPACPRSPAGWSATWATTSSAGWSGCPRRAPTTSACPSWR